jgi:hypothetical protein
MCKEKGGQSAPWCWDVVPSKPDLADVFVVYLRSSGRLQVSAFIRCCALCRQTY